MELVKGRIETIQNPSLRCRQLGLKDSYSRRGKIFNV